MSTVSESHNYARFDELAEEFAERYRRGERPSLEEYVGRLPQMADEIREMFPALVEVERAEEEARCPPNPASVHQVPSLALVGDYRILREVGRGGMGVVYEAEQVSLGRRVALKVLPDLVASDRKCLERFRREAKAAARLHHTNIVPVFEVGREGGVAFYAMQFIHGQGLDQVIDELARLRDPDHPAINPHASASEGVAAFGEVTASLPGAAGGSGQPTRSLGPVALSLLNGRLATERSETPVGDSFASPGAAVTEQLDMKAAAPPTALRVIEPDPAGPKAGSGLSASAVFPGGIPVSSAENSRRRLPFFRSVAQIGRQAAQALDYAHARGIVHRDIKPSNLLLDTAGIVWITDFGLAKAGDDGLTATGDLLGTLRYMAPERFRGQCDSRADIYALGLTLYELLTLRPAFESSDRLMLISQIQNQEPVRPRAIDSRIPRDLETIVLKAIDKEPARRYPSAAALAEDLRRFLDDEPITARPVTAVKLLMKFARRQPAVTALAALFLGAVFFGVAGISWKWREAIKNLNLASTQRKNALYNLSEANEQRSIALLKIHEASEKAASLERQLYFNRIQLAQNAWSTDNSAAVLDILNRCRPELRDWEWSYLHRLCHLEKRAIEGGMTGLAFSPDGRRVASADRTHRVKVWDTSRGDLVHTLAGHLNTVYSIAFSPDGRLLASGSRDTTIRLWDASTGEFLRTLEAHGSWVRSVAFSPDGTRLVSGSGAEQFTPGKTAELILWDVASGREIRRFAGPHDRIYGVAHRPDGKQIASIDCDPSLKLWNPESGALEHRLVGHTNDIDCVAYSPDGRILATAGRDQVVILWDVAAAKMLHTLRGHDSSIASLDFSPDGKLLVSADINAAIKLWDIGRGAEIAHLRNSSGVTGVRFDPTGRQIATVGVDHELKLWDSSTFKSVEYRTLGGHRGSCYRAAYTPDGTILATTGLGLVRLWDASTGKHVRDIETGFDSGIYGLAIRSDGRMLAMAQEQRPTHIDLVDLETVSFRRLEGHRSTVNCLAFAPGGAILASAGDDMEIRIWDAAAGRTIATLAGHTAAVDALVFSPDGKLLASQGLDSAVRIWDVAQARLIQVHEGVPLRQSSSFGSSLAFSLDGKRLAAARSDATVTIWDLSSGAPVLTLSGHREAVNSVAFLNSRRVVTASDDRTIKVWDLATGENVLTLRGHSSAVLGLACRPDGSQIATTGSDDARIWDTATSNEARANERTSHPTTDAPPIRAKIWPTSVLTGHQAQINRIAYTPDGQTIVTVSDDTTIRLWEPATGRPQAVLRGHQAPVTALAISPNGRLFATGEGDWRQSKVPAQIKLWDASSRSCIASWQAHDRAVWSLAFSPDGNTLASGSSDGLVKLWDPASHAERARLDSGTFEWVRGLAFKPDGKALASSHQSVIRLWDLTSLATIAELKGHSGEITALAISPDGKYLASASRDGTVILWDRQSARQLATITGNEGWVNDVKFSPDGKTLSFGVMDASVKLWDVESRKTKAVEHVREGCSLGVAFSPDGKTIASGHNPFGILSRVAK